MSTARMLRSVPCAWLSACVEGLDAHLGADSFDQRRPMPRAECLPIGNDGRRLSLKPRDRRRDRGRLVISGDFRHAHNPTGQPWPSA